jgi:molybdopterin molybdotransferase
MVAAWLRRRGIVATVARLPDDAEQTRERVEAALNESDLVVTTGGVSVGEKDFVIGAARASGVVDGFWKVAQKPGKPLYFGTRADCVFLGLPGNPAAVFVGLSVHVARILALLAGQQEVRPMLRGTTAVALRRSPDRAIWHRASVDTGGGEPVLQPLEGQASHMLGNLSECTALALVPPGTAEIPAGAEVEWVAV